MDSDRETDNDATEDEESHMFLRRRHRERQVHLSLPRGHQVEVTLPRPPWKRQPARSRWARPQIAAAIAAIGAAIAYLAGLARKRGSASDDTPIVQAPAGANGQVSAITPATRPPTSDREPDEIDRLSHLDPTRR